VILWAGSTGNRYETAPDNNPICLDCQRGRLQWAEAGYVAWHRICDVCGSHWDLHPITWGPGKPCDTTPLRVPTGNYRCGHIPPAGETVWCVECEDELDPLYDLVPAPQFVRFIDGIGTVPLEPGEKLFDTNKTWGDLLSLITPEMWARAREPERVRQMADSVVIPCAYARRARFY
jgi:hypothetical protein